MAPTDFEGFEGLLKDLVGDQVKKLQAKLQEMARDAVKDELAKLHTEVAELRTRIVTLEAERAQSAAESLESSF